MMRAARERLFPCHSRKAEDTTRIRAKNAFLRTQQKNTVKFPFALYNIAERIGIDYREDEA